MAIRSILTTKADFKGHMPVTDKTSTLWRFDEPLPDEQTRLKDASPHGRHLTISGWSGTTASMIDGWQGRYIRINRTNPTTEKTFMTAAKHGFYQYTAACDSKHRVRLQEGASACVYFEYEPMLEGEIRQ